MEETNSLALPHLPFPAITLPPPPTPLGPRVRCLRCRNHKKKCKRVPGEDCVSCQKAGVLCGRSLNAKEARAFIGRPIPDSVPKMINDDSHAGRSEAPSTVDYRYKRNVTESDSSGEGTAYGFQNSPKEVGVFDRNHLGDNISKWSEKLDHLLLFQSTLRESQAPLYSQAPQSSGPAASLGFALQDVARELQWTVEEFTNRADAAVANGDNDRADRIFLNILDCLQNTDCLSVPLRCVVLSKMTLFYRDIGNEARSQRVLRVLSSLATSTGYEPMTENHTINPHRMLATSPVKTSKTLHTSFVKTGFSSVDAIIRSPALNQSLRCENPEVFQATLEIIDEGRACGTVERASTAEFDSKTSSSSGTLDSDECLNTRDTLGRSPFFIAAALGKESCCKDLLDAGARADDRDCNGRTVLTIAASQNLVKTTKRILAVKIQEANPLNLWHTSTPLQEAAVAGHLEIVKMLVQHGADLRTPRLWDGGKTAVQLARDNGHAEVAQELEQSIADLDSQLFLTARDPDFTRDLFAQELPSDFGYSMGKIGDDYLL